MYEALILMLAGIAGMIPRRDFLRGTLVDHSQGPVVEPAGTLVLRKPITADKHRSCRIPGSRARSLAEAGGGSSRVCDGAPCRHLAHAKPAGDQPCALVPTN